MSPYLGIGWGRSPGSDGGWSVTADIGVFYLGDADIDVAVRGPSSANPLAQDAIDEERDELEDDIDRLSVYPVVMLGVGYRF